MKKILFVLLLSLSTTTWAESCQQTAIRLATDINVMYQGGATVSGIKKQFDYNANLLALVTVYTTMLAEFEPKNGWTRAEYRKLAQAFAKEICK